MVQRYASARKAFDDITMECKQYGYDDIEKQYGETAEQETAEGPAVSAETAQEEVSEAEQQKPINETTKSAEHKCLECGCDQPSDSHGRTDVTTAEIVTEKSADAEEIVEEEVTVVSEEQVQEDLKALVESDSNLSEEFKEKATVLFNSALTARLSEEVQKLEEKKISELAEEVESIRSELVEKIDGYLNYVVEQWVEENQIAIESGLRSELTEEFIAGLRNLFAEHYIDVPEDKVDLVDELSGKVEDLETKLNEEIERGIEYKKALVESTKTDIVRTVCEGLTATQVEKIKSLAESVEFSTEEEFTEKLETIRENYFPSGIVKADEKQLHEQVEDAEAGEKKTAAADPYVASVMQAISKTKI
jgi:hypothetical protein